MSAFRRGWPWSIIAAAIMASCTRPSDPGAAASQPAPSSEPAAAASSSPSPAASPAPAASTAAPPASQALTGSDGLKAYGGTFVCEERVYPQPPTPHITWWGWTFKVDAKAKYQELAKAFPAAERDDADLTLRFSRAPGERPTVVVSFEDVAAPRRLPKCKQPLPADAKSRAVVSTMP